MNGKDLLNKMSDVDDKLIVGAEKAQKKKRGLFIGVTSGVATVAAAAAVAVVIGINSGVTPPPIESSNTSTPSDSTVSDSSNISTPGNSAVTPIVLDPPVLDFSAYSHLAKISLKSYDRANGFGSEPTEFSIDKIKSGSPWSADANIITMPVYMSSSTDLDLDKMYKYVKETAALLGISESGLAITDNYPKPEDFEQYRKLVEDSGASKEEVEQELDRVMRVSMQFTQVIAKAEGVEITLSSDYSLRIKFDTPIELPEEYNFTESASDSEKAQALSYLSEKYGSLLQYSKPTAAKNYDSIDIYDSDCGLEQQIANYWMNYTIFSFNSDEPGKLQTIFIYSDKGCEKLGDYPILTAEQAEAILKSKRYSDEERMSLDATIVETDLIYVNRLGTTGVIPYYYFYVDSGERSDNGGVICKRYKIAAIPEQFLDGVDTDDYGVYA